VCVVAVIAVCVWPSYGTVKLIAAHLYLVPDCVLILLLLLQTVYVEPVPSVQSLAPVGKVVQIILYRIMLVHVINA
jgi:hypothetical protein